MWITSPKEKCFPETIPEEISSTEDEQVVSCYFKIETNTCIEFIN